MEIILLKNIDKVGDKHEIVTVKNGYGRNYLIPQGMAIIANKRNKAKLDALIAREEAAEALRVGEYQGYADKLKEVVLKIGAKSGTSGKIFGSVTNVQLAQAIKEQVNIEVDRRKINLLEEVKELGTYTAEVLFHKDVDCKVNFEVIAE